MPSRREQLVLAAVAALDAAGKPAGLAVHRFRTRPIQKDQLPALVVYPAPDGEAVARGDGARGYKARRTLVLRVECRAIAPDGTPCDAALDPYTSWAVRALMQDPTLGGLALNAQEAAVLWDAEELDRVYAAAAVDVRLDYVTAAADPDLP